MGRGKVLALLLVGGMTAAAAEPPWSLAELMALLSARGDSRARFVEEKHLALLKEPLRQEGSVEFRKPAYLAKHVVKPVEEHYLIDGDTVTVEKPGEGVRTHLSLADYPALAAFVASLRAPLAGDIAALERYYHPYLGGTRSHWRLALAPADPALAGRVRQVTLEGREGRVERLEIEELGGDRSVLRFEPGP
ncbi:LolA-related protein [Candidatus Methylocalor cossyra]|uniref:Outer membrane lipoprotein-sorting protein n=1 Tax=Candidatus Methylocalor cossyra TaxID=3108543 RepID=A0ABM9NHC7_9GAMM